MLIIHVVFLLNKLLYNFLQPFKPQINLSIPIIPIFPFFPILLFIFKITVIYNETGIFESLVVQAEISLKARHAADESEVVAAGE